MSRIGGVSTSKELTVNKPIRERKNAVEVSSGSDSDSEVRHSINNPTIWLFAYCLDISSFAMSAVHGHPSCFTRLTQ